MLVAPPGLDLGENEPPVQSTEVRRIVVLGRLAPWKGQDLLIRAFATAFAGTSVGLDIVGGALFGEQEFERHLQDLVLDLGLEHQVLLHGHLDDPNVLLEGADVMVHCSRLPEPFGAVVIEGMHAGCVVIATQPGGPAETIVDGLTGMLVEAGDEEAMLTILGRVREMPQQARADMAHAARSAASVYDAGLLSAAIFGWLSEVGRGEARPGVVDAIERQADHVS